MAIQLTHTMGGIVVPLAYHRIDRLIVEHGAQIIAQVTTYATPARAAARDPLPVTRQYAIAWPAVPTDPTAHAYTELMKHADFVGGVSV